jgi:2-(1,2-epoxy-1,2-dihydrophenyl)acetyl-CoA isomerase
LPHGKIEARAVVLTGEGRGFCSGANLSGGGAAGREAGRRRQAGRRLGAGEHLQPADDPAARLSAADRDGREWSGGRGRLLDGADGRHHRGGESAYFLQAFRRIGLVPDGGSTYLLPR